MNDQNLEQKIAYLKKNIAFLPKEVKENYESSFMVHFTHHSTAIEGNTLTLQQTKLVMEDGISVGGKSLREIYEVVNHRKAFQYCGECLNNKIPLDEKIVKELHALLMENILEGGIYRSVDVSISGSEVNPPSPNKVYSEIKLFYDDLQNKQFQNELELAAFTHLEFVRIHPFVDGNGRTARMMMNYQLLSKGLLPIAISNDTREEYINSIQSYILHQDIRPFLKIIGDLEETQINYYMKAIEDTKRNG